MRRRAGLQGSRKSEKKWPARPSRLPQRQRGGGGARRSQGRLGVICRPLRPSSQPRPRLYAPPSSHAPPFLVPLHAPPSSSAPPLSCLVLPDFPSCLRPAPSRPPRPSRALSFPGPPLHAPPLLSEWLALCQPSVRLAQHQLAVGASNTRPRGGGSGAEEGQLRGPRPRGSVGAGGSRGRAGAAAAPTDMRQVSSDKV